MHVDLPRILGSDAAGVVSEVGQDINEFNIGDNVVVQPGVYNTNCNIVRKGKENLSPTYGILGETENGVQSEFVILDPINLYQMPEHLTHIQAAAMPLTFMTSYQMLVKRANICSDDIVLVYGATSGVGYAAIQIAKDMGSKVLSTVGSKNKIEHAQKAGSDEVFLHDQNLYQNIKKYLGKKKINIVFEHIGQKTWETSMRLLDRGGKVVTCGATTGSDVRINLTHLFFKQLSILGSTMSDINSFKEMMNKIENKKYFPLIDKIFPFSDIVDAHERIESRKNIGKVIIDFKDM